MEYREVEYADIPSLTRIRAQGGDTEEYWTWRITGYLNQELHPHRALMPRVMYVATDGDTIAGFIAGHLSERFGYDGELQWIDVLPEYKRKGIASRLLYMLAKWFADQNVHRVCVNVGGEEGRKFYFRHEAKQMNEYWMTWEDVGVVLKNETII